MSWKNLFTDEEIAIGEFLFRTGKAKKLTVEDDGAYSCIVRDDRNHRVSAYIDRDSYFSASCDCENFLIKNRCTHLAALMFLKEDQHPGNERSEEYINGSDPTHPWDERMYYDRDLRPAVRNLRKLSNDEKQTHEPDVSGGYVDDKYRAFYPEDFLNGLSYSKTEMSKAKKIIEENKFSHPEVSLVITDKDGRHPIEGKMSVYLHESSFYYGERVDLEFTSHSITNMNCQSWDCSYDRNKISVSGPCHHVLAAILLLRDELETNLDIDKTDARTHRFIRSFEGTGSGETDSGMTGKLHLNPVLSLNDKSDLTLSFRIGNDKLYKVKDIGETLEGIRRGVIKRFGKNTDISLEEAYLDDSSRSWFLFASDILEEESMQIGYYDDKLRSYEYNHYKMIKSEIPLFGKNLDAFFESASGSSIEASLKGKQTSFKGCISFEDSDYRLKLVIDTDMEEDIFHGLYVSGEIPELFKGQKCFYYFDDGIMKRIPYDTSRALRVLDDIYTSGRIEMHVGRGHLAEFYRNVIPKLREFADVQINNEETIISHIPPLPQFVTFFDYQDSFILCNCDVYYGGERVELLDLIDASRNEKQLESYRDEEKEGEFLELLLSYVHGYDSEQHVLLQSKNDEDTYMFMSEGLDKISAKSEIRVTDRFRRLIRRRKPGFNVGVSVASDIMNLSVTGDELSQDEIFDILSAYRRKQKFFKLKDGSFLSLENDEALERLTALMETLHLSPREFVKGKMQIPLYRALYVEKMLEENENLRVDRDKHYRSLLKEFKTVEDAAFETPEGLKSVMRSYQTTGYRWLMTLDHYGFGGILADEMGLGKTLQAIAMMSTVLGSEKGSLALVVCPASLVYNWQEEIKRYAPDLMSVAIAGTAKERESLISKEADGNVWITSYDLLKRDISLYEDIRFRLFFIDEAQYIKNQGTAAAKSVRLIKSKGKFALTGTPIENRLGELWSIFEFLMPDFLYDYPTFKKELELPAVKYQDEEAADLIKKMVSPFILRRRKTDVLRDLPDKLEEIRYAKMEPAQAKLYDAQVMHMKSMIGMKSDEDMTRSRIEILAELTKIRQICCDPSLCFDGYKGGSAKLEMCMELLSSLADGGHKTLLFSQFTTMLELIEAELEKSELSYYKITGATPKEKRLELVNSFNEDDTRVFLISLKAGGTGLNLTGADSVIHYDPWWNIAAENQATDRAHRIGQKNIVTVYKLIIKDSVEEKILHMQEEKSKLAEDILSSEGVSSSMLDRNELLELLHAGA